MRKIILCFFALCFLMPAYAKEKAQKVTLNGLYQKFEKNGNSTTGLSEYGKKITFDAYLLKQSKPAFSGGILLFLGSSAEGDTLARANILDDEDAQRAGTIVVGQKITLFCDIQFASGSNFIPLACSLTDK